MIVIGVIYFLSFLLMMVGIKFLFPYTTDKAFQYLYEILLIMELALGYYVTYRENKALQKKIVLLINFGVVIFSLQELNWMVFSVIGYYIFLGLAWWFIILQQDEYNAKRDNILFGLGVLIWSICYFYKQLHLNKIILYLLSTSENFILISILLFILYCLWLKKKI